MNDVQTPIEGWCILELFGHQKLAGYVSTVIIGTSGMLRCDVPEVDDTPAYTRFYGPGAIYSLTLVTEDVARLCLKALKPEAVTVYIPRHLLAAGASEETKDETTAHYAVSVHDDEEGSYGED